METTTQERLENIQATWTILYPDRIMTLKDFDGMHKFLYGNIASAFYLEDTDTFQYTLLCQNTLLSQKIVPVVQDRLQDCVLILMKKSDPEKVTKANCEYINGLIDVNNFEELLDATNNNRNEQLDKICFDFFVKNITDDKFIVRLSYESLKFIVESQQLNTVSELDVFIMISRWLNGQAKLSNKFKSLLTNINFASISVENLVKIIKPTGLITNDCFAQAIVDSFDDTKNKSWRPPSKTITKPNMTCEIGIGYYDKADQYPGYRIFQNSDFNTDINKKKFVSEFEKYNGFIALDDMDLTNLSYCHREIKTLEKNIITAVGSQHGNWRAYPPDVKVAKGSVVEISFYQDKKNPQGSNFRETTFHGYVNPKAMFAFFIKI